jgi:hypothetical protein
MATGRAAGRPVGGIAEWAISVWTFPVLAPLSGGQKASAQSGLGGIDPGQAAIRVQHETLAGAETFG